MSSPWDYNICDHWRWNTVTCDSYPQFLSYNLVSPNRPEVFLKSISKVGKSGSKMFTLHGIDSSKVASRDNFEGRDTRSISRRYCINDSDVGTSMKTM